MTNEKDLIIFILSYGRKKVPTLNLISNKQDVIILTSEDNPFKDSIIRGEAKVMFFDRYKHFIGRGIEMMNEESIPHRNSALYGYNFTIEYGRKNGYKYVLVLDDDYLGAETINNRNEGNFPKIDLWAHHIVAFLKKYPFIAAAAAVNNGQLFTNSKRSFFSNLNKRQLMNTIIFNTAVPQYFHSLGNGDYVNSCMINLYSRYLAFRAMTIRIVMETINDKKHKTVDYSNMFFARWSVKMVCPSYADVKILVGNKGQMGKRFNTVIKSGLCPKIVSL